MIEDKVSSGYSVNLVFSRSNLHNRLSEDFSLITPKDTQSFDTEIEFERLAMNDDCVDIHLTIYCYDEDCNMIKENRIYLGTYLQNELKSVLKKIVKQMI